MSWRDSLRPASLGGIAIHTDDRKLAGGRRIRNHEFPKRDDNLPEDMGRRTRHFTLEAYVIGDDYMARRDALIARCEKGGPMGYVDHWGRSQQVACDTYEVTEMSAEGRYAKIALKLVNAGASNGLVATIAAGAQLVGAAAALSVAAGAAFAQLYNR